VLFGRIVLGGEIGARLLEIVVAQRALARPNAGRLAPAAQVIALAPAMVIGRVEPHHLVILARLVAARIVDEHERVRVRAVIEKVVDTLVFEHPNIEAIAGLLVRMVAEANGAPFTARAVTPSERAAAVSEAAARIAELSEDEVEALLVKKLESL